MAVFQYKLIWFDRPCGFISVMSYICKGQPPLFRQSSFNKVYTGLQIPVSSTGLNQYRFDLFLIRCLFALSAGIKLFDLRKGVYQFITSHHTRETGKSHQEGRKVVSRKDLLSILYRSMISKTAAHSRCRMNRNPCHVDRIYVAVNGAGDTSNISASSCAPMRSLSRSIIIMLTSLSTFICSPPFIFLIVAILLSTITWYNKKYKQINKTIETEEVYVYNLCLCS